jgi:hypothetical protein
MWPLVKPLIVGFAVSVGLAVAGFVGMQLAISAISFESFEVVGLEIYLAFALLMLFFPAFSAGYVARHHGSLYGVVLAGVPIALFSLANKGLPVLFYFSWVFVAAVGGYSGQTIARRKHAP